MKKTESVRPASGSTLTIMGTKKSRHAMDRKSIGTCMWCGRPASKRAEVPYVPGAHGELVVARTTKGKDGTITVQDPGRVTWETEEVCPSCYNQVHRTGSLHRTQAKMRAADVRKALEMVSQGYKAADAWRWLEKHRGVKISRPGFYAALERGYQEFGYPDE